MAGGKRLTTTFSPWAGALDLGAFAASVDDWPAVAPFAFRDSSCGVLMAGWCSARSLFVRLNKVGE